MIAPLIAPVISTANPIIFHTTATLPALLLQFGGSSSSLLTGILPFVLMIGVFYMLLIRPNQTRQKKWKEMLESLKSGDRVTTTGGIRGTIFAIKDDVIQLRVPPDNLKLEFSKAAIASVVTPDEGE